MRIPPLHHEPAEFLNWRVRAGSHLSSLLSERHSAIHSLTHTDSNIRSSALWAFIYHWGLDDLVVSLFVERIEEDDDLGVRSEALSGLAIAMHSTPDAGHREEIRDLLLQVADRQVHDSDLGSAIAIHVAGLEVCKAGFQLNELADTTA